VGPRRLVRLSGSRFRMVSLAPLTERSASRARGAGARAAGRPTQNEAARGWSRGPLRTRRSEPVQAAVGISPSCRIQNRQQHPLATRARADGRRPERRATADIDRALFEWIIVDSEMIADRYRTRYPPPLRESHSWAAARAAHPGAPEPSMTDSGTRVLARTAAMLFLVSAAHYSWELRRGPPVLLAASRRPRRAARGEPPPRGGERAPRPAHRGR